MEKEFFEFSSLLLNDKKIVKTFFDAYERLKEARRKREIGDEEFLKGLLEILEAISIFAKYEGAFSKQEKQLQIAVLKGFLESALTFFEEIVGKKPELREKFEDLKRRHFIGLEDDKSFWEKLLLFSSSLAERFHSETFTAYQIKLLIPLLVAFIKFYYWALLQKREAVEDLL
jgi:hypothetical protein